jgi:hypothetical protein
LCLIPTIHPNPSPLLTIHFPYYIFHRIAFHQSTDQSFQINEIAGQSEKEEKNRWKYHQINFQIVNLDQKLILNNFEPTSIGESFEINLGKNQGKLKWKIC